MLKKGKTLNLIANSSNLTPQKKGTILLCVRINNIEKRLKAQKYRLLIYLDINYVRNHYLFYLVES